MQALEEQLREAGDLTMGGQIVDASLVSALKQRKTENEKASIKTGNSARQTGVASRIKPTIGLLMRVGG